MLNDDDDAGQFHRIIMIIYWLSKRCIFSTNCCIKKLQDLNIGLFVFVKQTEGSDADGSNDVITQTSLPV